MAPFEFTIAILRGLSLEGNDSKVVKAKWRVSLIGSLRDT